MTLGEILRARKVSGSSLPILENGDFLDQKTFHERYEAMPPGTRAELIGGMVYMASPVSNTHGKIHNLALFWLTTYMDATPGVDVINGSTTILGEDSEPQPDAGLRLIDGQTKVKIMERADYIIGAPELVCEVASSTESYDLRTKKADYERHGVQEYLLLMLREKRVIWFKREGGRLVEDAAGSDGVMRSRVFPGLWLDPSTMLGGDLRAVTAMLRQGLQTPEHSQFVQQRISALKTLEPSTNAQ